MCGVLLRGLVQPHREVRVAVRPGPAPLARLREEAPVVGFWILVMVIIDDE